MSCATGHKNTCILPIASTVAIFHGLLQAGKICSDVHIVETRNHGTKKDLRSTAASSVRLGAVVKNGTNHFSPELPCLSAIRSANLARSAENRYSSLRSEENEIEE